MTSSLGLPTKLNNEPLVDAVFEIRFLSSVPASSIIPGVLYSKLAGNKSLEPLPTEQIPKNIRDTDPNLRYAPVSRLNWDKFYISVSDRSVMVSCKHPYAGWSAFKSAIVEVLTLINDIKVIDSVERYSMKYVDIIESDDLATQVNMINMKVSLAEHMLTQEAVQLRMEIPDGDFIKVIQVATGAVVKLPQSNERNGVVIDVDIIAPLENLSFSELLSDIESRLDVIHQMNKFNFFGCLKTETIEMLEPSYD